MLGLVSYQLSAQSRYFPNTSDASYNASFDTLSFYGLFVVPTTDHAVAHPYIYAAITIIIIVHLFVRIMQFAGAVF